MARLSEQEKRNIIARDKPGRVLVEHADGLDPVVRHRMTSERSAPDLAALQAKVGASSGPTPVIPDAQSAAGPAAAAGAQSELDSLRRFFIDGDPAAADVLDAAAAAEAGSGPSTGALDAGPSALGADDVEIVPVRPAGRPADPYDALAQQPKGVVVSGSRKRVIGEQG